MSAIASPYGLSELEEEFEGEWEAESESEQFFGWLRRQWSALQTPGTWQRRAALGAGRAALTSGAGLAGAGIGSLATAGPWGAPVGAAIGAPIGAGLAGAILPEREFETEFEVGLNPLRRLYPDALMEHLGHAATGAQTEAEAEAFLGALIPLAARLVPRIAPALLRATPNLVRGVAAAGRALRANPATAPLVRVLPSVVRNTALSLGRQAAAGTAVTPQQAVRTLARQTTRLVGNPPQTVAAYQRSRVLDGQFHRQGQTAGCTY